MMLRRRFIQQAGALGLLGTGLPAAFGAAAGVTDPYTWKSVPYGAGGFIDGFMFHPREKGLLYARTDIGGAYRFDPATRSWIPLLDQLTRSQTDLSGVLSLALDPNDANRVYIAGGLYLNAGNRNGALLASADRGVTWQINELPIKLGGNSPGRGSGERLQVDPDNGEILFLGTSQDGLMVSKDRGRSFTSLGFAPRHVSLVLVDPRSGRQGAGSQTLWVGSHDKPGLYVSRDGGRSFALEPATPAQAPQRAALAGDGTLYVTFAIGDGATPVNPSYAKRGSVWRRDPAGRWTDITPEDPARDKFGFGYSGVDVDRQVPGRLVVSTIERWSKGDDVFISDDGGAHWTSLGAHSQHDASRYPWLVNYMKGEDKMGHWLADIKLDPFDGLWLTDNLGAALKGGTVAWDFAVANLEETATLEIRSPSGGATLLAAMGDVSGAAWDDVAKTPRNGLFAPSNQTNRSVDFAQLRPAIIARTADQAATGGWWSSDGSVTWKPFGASPRITRSAAPSSRAPSPSPRAARRSSGRRRGSRPCARATTARPGSRWQAGPRARSMPSPWPTARSTASSTRWTARAARSWSASTAASASSPASRGCPSSRTGNPRNWSPRRARCATCGWCCTTPCCTCRTRSNPRR